jgi:hypothetical protein
MDIQENKETIDLTDYIESIHHFLETNGINGPIDSDVMIDAEEVEPDDKLEIKEENDTTAKHEDKKETDDGGEIEHTDAEPKIKLSLVSLKIVATWKYTTENQECLLCKKDLMMPIQDSCNVTISGCNHGFHATCLKNYKQFDDTCPYCSEKWITKSSDNIVDTTRYKSTS